MRKNFIITLFLIFATVQMVHSERIIGSGATLYHLQKKESMVLLQGNVNVEAGPLIKGYYAVMLWVKCGANDLDEDNNIKAGRKLYDTLNQQVGYARLTIHPSRRVLQRGDSLYIELIGRIEKFSINQSTILELDLDKIFSLSKKEMLYADFEKHFERFPYQLGPGSGSFNSRLYMDGGVESLSPNYRLILVFHKKDLAAIIYTREIHVPYYESQASSMPYKIYYMKKMTDVEKKEIATLYL